MNRAIIADSFRIMGNLGSHFAHLTDVSISPDGRFLSSSDQNGVLVIRNAGGMFHRIRYFKATTPIRSTTWMTAVPSVLLVGCGNGDAHVLILRETAPDFKRLEILDGSISSITTSDRGSLVAMAVGDMIVLADQDPHALEKAWSNIRRIGPPDVASKGEIPLIQNLHIVGEDIIIVSHLEAVFGIRAISTAPPFEELWRIPLRAGTYIGCSAISPSKDRMVVTNTVNGLDIYSLKRQRHSGTVEYEVHRNRRIFGVAFLDENNIVAANESNFVFAEVGQQEPEIRCILPSTDQEILQLIAVGHIQDKPYIVATHNLLSGELRGERCITVAHQVTQEEVGRVDAEPSVKRSVKPANLDTSPSPQFVELGSDGQTVERPQIATNPGAPTPLYNYQPPQAMEPAPGSRAHQHGRAAAHPEVTVAVNAPTDPVVLVNANPSADHATEAPRNQPSSPIIRTWAIVILAATMLFFWSQSIGSLTSRMWRQQTARTVEVEASPSVFSMAQGNPVSRIGASTVVLSMISISPGLEGNSETHTEMSTGMAHGLPLVVFGSGPEEHQELRDSVAPITTTQTRIETRVITLTNETQVVERPPEAPASRSNWPIYLMFCFIFLVIVTVVVVLFRHARTAEVPFEASKWANSLTGALKDFGVKRDDAAGLGQIRGNIPSNVMAGAGNEARGRMRHDGVPSVDRAENEARSGIADEEVPLTATPDGAIRGETQLAYQAGGGAGGSRHEGVPLVNASE